MSSAGVEKRGSASTVRACDLCRKRKRKCVWTSGTSGCTPCTNLKETCTTTYQRKPRAKPQRGNRIVEYESRIKRLESLLQERNEAQPHVRQKPLLQDTSPSVPLSTWVESLRQEVETGPHPLAPDFNPYDFDATEQTDDFGFADGLSALSMNESQTHYPPDPTLQFPLDSIEPSAGFQEDAAYLQSAIFEPEATEDISTLPPPLPTQSACCDWYLPPPELGTSLLAEFLMDMNTAYPLYQPHVIADHLRICYAGLSDGTSVAWTSAYVVFGLAHVLRAMSVSGTKHDTDMAQYYLARIYLSLNGLLTAPPSLGQVQCLLGVAALIMRSPCNYHKSEAHFVSTALRIICSLVYDDETDGARDGAQERRVFWIAFINDTHLAILNNTEATHQLEDVADCKDFEADELGQLTAAEGNWRVQIFWLHTRLALLQTEATDQILSSKARNASTMDTAAAATIVLARLDAFHDQHEIFQLDAGRLFQLLYRSDIMYIVSLEASYFATVYRIHAFMALEMNARINPFQLHGLTRMSEVRQHKAYSTAKRLLSLLPVAPRGNVGLYWMMHPVFAAALVTVFAHHIHNPTNDVPTSVEMHGYLQLLSDFGTMIDQCSNTELKENRDLCLNLYSKLEASLRIRRSQGYTEREEASSPSALASERIQFGVSSLI